MIATTTRIQVFDTTLRDGEQAPGFSMTAAEKLRLAQQLDRLGVDIIEAGFPISSDGDFEAVRTIAGGRARPIIRVLARPDPRTSIAPAALSQAARPRIDVFFLRLGHPSRIQAAHHAAAVPPTDRRSCPVALRAPHATTLSSRPRMRREVTWHFLCEVAEVAVNAGATTINLPDNVGYALPDDIERMYDRRQDRGDPVAR